MQYFVGVDIGRFQDPTAIGVLKRVQQLREFRQANVPTWVKRATKVVREYDLVRLERPSLGTDYRSIVTRVREIMTHPLLVDDAALIVDATGVGAAVIDMMREEKLAPIPIIITSGSATNRNAYGWYRVPKLDLMTPLQLLFQGRRIHFAQGMELTPVFKQELADFRLKITPAGNQRMEGDGRTHDDLALAVAMPAWYAETIEASQFPDGVIEDDDQEEYDPLTWGMG